MANPRRLVVVARAPRGEVGQVAPPSVRGPGVHAAVDRARIATTRPSRCSTRRSMPASPPRHGRRVLPRRRRHRPQRAADRPRDRDLDGRSLPRRVATKGGLTRPAAAGNPMAVHGTWPRRASASRRALGVDRIALYQLHAPDPRTPLATSVRALGALRRDGLVEAIGLCNVTVGQIEDARRITDIASVQVELSVWHDEHLLSGVADYCVGQRHPLLAYRPLGGGRRVAGGSPPIRCCAASPRVTRQRHARSRSPALMDLRHRDVPLPGPTRRRDRPVDWPRAHAIVLTDEDRAALDERLPSRAGARRQLAGSRRPALRRAMAKWCSSWGCPGAGKSTRRASLVAQGYRAAQS